MSAATSKVLLGGLQFRLLFAAITLSPQSGGIAILSRQVVRALTGMQRDGMICLELHVLEGSGDSESVNLFGDDLPVTMRWYGGNRLLFTLALLRSQADFRLFDHVGLARVLSLPGFAFTGKRPFAVLVHGVELWRSERADYLRSARRASLLIANSNYTARQICARYPDGLPRIQVCWPGIDLPARTESTERAGSAVPISPHAMLIVGRLDSRQRHKGHDQLIEAMPSILDSIPDAQLVVAGTGDDRERLERKVREFGLTNCIHFTGWLSDAQLDDLYLRCALFVMPSDGDGFGLVFLEAMARGLPCVGLKGTSAAEIFGDGVAGLLVDREDGPAMAKELVALLADQERRRTIGQTGLARYRQLFQSNHFRGRLQSALLSHVAEFPRARLRASAATRNRVEPGS